MSIVRVKTRAIQHTSAPTLMSGQDQEIKAGAGSRDRGWGFNPLFSNLSDVCVAKSFVLNRSLILV